MGAMWLAWLGWSFGLAAGISPSALSAYEKSCEDEQHVSCIQQGSAWLSDGALKLSKEERERVVIRLVSAYVAVGQPRDAMKLLAKILRENACLREIAGLSDAAKPLFRKAREAVLRDDVEAPVMSHDPPTVYQLLEKPVLEVKVTDDQKVASVTAYIRYRADAPWREIPMEEAQPTYYQAKLSADAMRKHFYLSYYLVAKDCAGRKSYAGGSEVAPRVVLLQGKGPTGFVVAGGLLVAAGIGLLVGGSAFFIAASENQSLWFNTNNLAESEIYRERIIFNYSLGWVGVGLGVLVGGLGAVFLVAPMMRAKEKPPSTAALQQMKAPLPSVERAASSLMRDGKAVRLADFP